MGSASQNRFATLLICATKADQNLWKITGVSLFTAAGPHPRGYSRLRFARRWLATTAFFQCDSAAHLVGFSRLPFARRWLATTAFFQCDSAAHFVGYSRLPFARRWLATTAFFQCDSAAHFVGYSQLRSPLASDDNLLSVSN